MDYIQTGDSNKLNFELRGKFTFSDHDKFREIINTIKTSSIKSATFDFSKVDFIDSAALGMLLIAKEEADTRAMTLILAHPNGQISKMFKVSKFDSMFTVR